MKDRKMLISLTAFGVWCWSLQFSSQFFGLVWSGPYILGFQTPFINVLLTCPGQIIKLQKKFSSSSEVSILDELNVLRLEIIRLTIILIGLGYHDVYQTQTELFWWKSVSLILQVVLEFGQLSKSRIVDCQMILLVLGTASTLINNLWFPGSLTLIIFQILLEFVINSASLRIEKS